MLKIERKKSILNCAERLFSEKGFYATSIADIIHSADIARGTFYLYFSNKKSIFDTLLDDLLDSLDKSIKRIDVNESSSSPLIQLKNNMMRVADVLYQKRNLTKILLSYAAGIDGEFDRKVFIFYEKVLQQIESALILGINMKLIRSCNPKIVAICILGSIKEIASSFISNGINNNALGKLNLGDTEIIMDEVIQFALTGLLLKTDNYSL